MWKTFTCWVEREGSAEHDFYHVCVRAKSKKHAIAKLMKEIKKPGFEFSNLTNAAAIFSDPQNWKVARKKSGVYIQMVDYQSQWDAEVPTQFNLVE